jgi:hypothetical protein
MRINEITSPKGANDTEAQAIKRQKQELATRSTQLKLRKDQEQLAKQHQKVRAHNGNSAHPRNSPAQ